MNQTVHIAVNAADQIPIWLNDLLITFDILSILAPSMLIVRPNGKHHPPVRLSKVHFVSLEPTTPKPPMDSARDSTGRVHAVLARAPRLCTAPSTDHLPMGPGTGSQLSSISTAKPSCKCQWQAGLYPHRHHIW